MVLEDMMPMILPGLCWDIPCYLEGSSLNKEFGEMPTLICCEAIVGGGRSSKSLGMSNARPFMDGVIQLFRQTQLELKNPRAGKTAVIGWNFHA